MILLAEHDEPSLAAKKKQQHVASETATSTPKNRVWNFLRSPLGRTGSDHDLSAETATGSVQYSYKNASGQGYYYTRDHLGSVRELCNGSGSIVARYSYDPYGRTTLASGTNLATFQYAGMYMHQPSGLNLTKYRAYDPNTGRWLSRDPLKMVEAKIGPNLYEYVKDDPIAKVDPLGLAGGAPKVGCACCKAHEEQWQVDGYPDMDSCIAAYVSPYSFSQLGQAAATGSGIAGAALKVGAARGVLAPAAGTVGSILGIPAAAYGGWMTGRRIDGFYYCSYQKCIDWGRVQADGSCK